MGEDYVPFVEIEGWHEVSISDEHGFTMFWDGTIIEWDDDAVWFTLPEEPLKEEGT